MPKGYFGERYWLMGSINLLRPWQISLLLGFLAALVGLVKYGIGVFPVWIYIHDLSVNWAYPSLSPLMVAPANYLQSNFVDEWLAELFGFTPVVSHFTFHVVLVIFVIALPNLLQGDPTVYVWRNHGVVAADAPIRIVWSGSLLYGEWESFFTLDNVLLPPEKYAVLG